MKTKTFPVKKHKILPVKKKRAREKNWKKMPVKKKIARENIFFEKLPVKKKQIAREKKEEKYARESTMFSLKK